MFLEAGEGNVDESTKNLNQEHISAESLLSYQIASDTKWPLPGAIIFLS